MYAATARIGSSISQRLIIFWMKLDHYKFHKKVSIMQSMLGEKYIDRMMRKAADTEREWQYGLNEVIQRLLVDTLPTEGVDALFVFGRAKLDDGEVLEEAARLHKLGVARHIVIPGTDGRKLHGAIPGEAWAGKDIWSSRLRKLGVEEPIHYGYAGYNTKTEGNGFIHLAKDMKWKTAAAFTHPHQITRAMLGLVRTINEEEMPLDIYTATTRGGAEFWNKEVYGSQGGYLSPRREHIQLENERIRTYQQSGHLATFEELFEYLSQRGRLVE